MLDTNRMTTTKLIEARRQSYLMLFHCVRIGLLCVGICLIAITAHAQQDAIGSMAPTATSAAGGWWSWNHSRSMLVIPQLNLDTAKFISLAVPGSPPVLSTHESIYPGVEYGNGWRPRHEGFKSLPDVGRHDAGPVEREPVSGSFFSFLNAKYTAWEAGLSDTRSLTDVNGALIYPLIEIHYAHWRLPLTLYVPPLRGSISR